MTAPLARARRFERSGFLAIDPKAFLELFIAAEAPPENVEIGDVVAVDIRGPLETRGTGWCDSYEAIRARVAAACESGAAGVVLRIDSPGGEAQGCFEAAREIRAMCAAAGKPLAAFVDGRACSAAYALASAAELIVLSDTATVGSIGVLSMRTDYSAMNASRGVRVAFIASGAHKTDGHPDAPITEAELKAEQQTVDSLAGVFFQLVADHRGMDPKAIAQLDARVLHGALAVQSGLADEVGTFGSLLARMAAGGNWRSSMTAYEKARKALEEAAQGEDPNAKAAQRALAALDAADGGGDDDAPADDKPDAADGDTDDQTTAADGDATDDQDPDATAPAAPGTTAASGGDTIALQALAEVHKLKAQIAQRDARDERERLIATRNDFAPEMVAALRKAPLKTVREMVATLPKGKPVAASTSTTPTTPTTSPRASAGDPARPPTLGSGQGDGTAAQLPPDAKQDLDRRMGLGPAATAAVNTPYKLTLGGAPVAPAAPPHAEDQHS